MASGVVVLGVLLRFSSPEGTHLELDVWLSRPAAASSSWTGVRSPPRAPSRRHRFGPWPVPRGASAEWVLSVEGRPVRRGSVPDFNVRPLRVAVYGGGGPLGPHRALMTAIERWRPHAVLDLGPGPPRADARAYLKVITAVAAGAPFLFVPGHGLFATAADEKGVQSGLEAPEDPLAQKLGAARGDYHLRVGPAALIGLARPEGLVKPRRQLQFLRAAARGAPLSFVILGHGPLSSGPRGGASNAALLLEAARAARVTALFSAQDRLYERLGRGFLSVVVSGGAGSPLDVPVRSLDRSAGAISTFHWVALEVFEDHVALRARSIEGLLLDRARLPPSVPARSSGRGEAMLLALGLLALALFVSVARLLRPGN